jgi:thymidylate kinase
MGLFARKDVKSLPRNRFIYITGCDGTGKTTQALLLIDQLRARGIKAKHLWLRFPFFFSVPLLAYARWRGLSWREEIGGFTFGYWDFHKSWVMRQVFPWILLLDSFLAAVWHIYSPLRTGYYIVCERFVLDMLVDLEIATGRHDIYMDVLGKLFINLIPADAGIFILDLDAETLRSRRTDLQYDCKLEERITAFRKLSSYNDYTQISSLSPKEQVNQMIRLDLGLMP